MPVCRSKARITEPIGLVFDSVSVSQNISVAGVITVTGYEIAFAAGFASIRQFNDTVDIDALSPLFLAQADMLKQMLGQDFPDRPVREGQMQDVVVGDLGGNRRAATGTAGSSTCARRAA